MVAGMILILALTCCAGCGGGGHSVAVKPDTKLRTDVESSIRNQQAMSDRIDELSGTLTKIQNTVSNVATIISNVIEQQFETFTGSQRLAFENFSGEMKTINENKTTTNTTAYGIGLVAVNLLFALALVWLVANIAKGILLKIGRR